MSNIELVIVPKQKDLGDNFVVRRALPHMKKRTVGPFIFWDHMGPVSLEADRDMTVRAHPHIGLATITWLFKGEIMHRDNLGNEQPIRPGEVNWMTAGSGIVHSERTHSKKEIVDLEGIQLWLALPKEHEDIEPSFYHCGEDSIPSIQHGDAQLRLIAGTGFNKKSPVPVFSDLFYFNAELKQGKLFETQLQSNHEGAIYVIDGQIEIEDQIFDPYNLIVLKQGGQLALKALKDAKFMYFGGQPFPEKRFIWWNFVSSSQEKIEAAKLKWKNDEFAPVINEDERIPLPES